MVAFTGKITDSVSAASLFMLICLFWAAVVSYADGADSGEGVIVIDEIILSTDDIGVDDKDHEDEDREEDKTEAVQDDGDSGAGGGDGDVPLSSVMSDGNGDLYETRKLLSSRFFSEPSGEGRLKIKEKLDEINAKLVFSAHPSQDALFYVVKAGDTLGKIAKRFDVSYESIMIINKKYRTNIRAGEQLKVIRGPFDILVDKSDFQLTLLIDGQYVKQYDVGIGKDDKTPVGKFEVAEKLIKPVWYSGDGVYPYGHPKNVLGTRWIGLKDKPGLYGYGIHGTAEPESIGKSESNGCVRLRNEDVEEIYAFVTTATRVTIQE